MSEHDELLKRIADYCSREKIAESTFGVRAINDGKLVQRLQGGGTITLRVYRQIEDFLAGRAPSKAPPRKRAA